MNFQIIEHNVHYNIKKYLFYFLLIELLIIVISISVFDEDLKYFKWILVATIVAWLVYSLLVKTYRNIGVCRFEKKGIFIMNNKDEKLIPMTEIIKLNLYYGGYKGEFDIMNFFITGRETNEGTNNHLVIKSNVEIRFQILVESIKHYKFLQTYFEQCRIIQLDAKIIY